MTSVSQNFEKLNISNIYRAPKVLEYFAKNYPQHFVFAPHVSVLEHIPLKICHLKLDQLASYFYISQVEYLILQIPEDLDNSSEHGWDNYQKLTSFCPNLKGILFYQKIGTQEYFVEREVFENYLRHYSPTTQTIWKARIRYWCSQNLQCISYSDYKSVLSQTRDSLDVSCTLHFDQHFIFNIMHADKKYDCRFFVNKISVILKWGINLFDNAIKLKNPRNI
jgi:hypothetical protein